MWAQRSLETASFLRDAFEQLDRVLVRKRACLEGTGGGSAIELKAAQQVIQRWLVIFAREHLLAICDKLMASAEEHETASTSVPPRTIPKVQLPSSSDRPHSVNEYRNDSIGFFILDSLKRVLAACADGGKDNLAPLRAAPDKLRTFCYQRVHISHDIAVRHVASECVGILSRVQLKHVVDLFLDGLAKVNSDREAREFVVYQRAARLIELSTHSAEQTASSIKYLKKLGEAMARTSRGVLRAEICASLSESLTRLMAPADELRLGEWAEFCASPLAKEWWSAYELVFGQLQRWMKKAAHATFCFSLMGTMLALADSNASGAGGANFATRQRMQHLLLYLATGLRKDAQREKCLGLAAEFVSTLKVSFLREDLANDSGGSASSSHVRLLAGSMLPRKLVPSPLESDAVERVLLAIGAARPEGLHFVRQCAKEVPDAQRALFLRVLAKLAENAPDQESRSLASLRSLVVPIVRAADGASPEAMTRSSPQLGAALLCLPYLWPVDGDKELTELLIVARLMQSEHRELCYNASLCLQVLVKHRPRELTLPVLKAVARM